MSKYFYYKLHVFKKIEALKTKAEKKLSKEAKLFEEDLKTIEETISTTKPGLERATIKMIKIKTETTPQEVADLKIECYETVEQLNKTINYTMGKWI